MYVVCSVIIGKLFSPLSITENPFLRITGEGPTFLQPSLEVLQLTVNGLFTIVNGTTVMATDTSAYQLSFQDESDNEVVMTPTDVSPSGAGPNELYVKYCVYYRIALKFHKFHEF